MARFFPASLRVRLMLLVLLAILPAAGLIVWSGLEQRDLSRTVAQDEVHRLAQVVASQQSQFVDGTEQYLAVLVGLVGRSDISDLDSEQCGRALAALTTNNERYTNIGITDTGGSVLCSAAPVDGGVVSERSWFARALGAGSFTAGEYEPGEAGSPPTIDFGYPVIGPDGVAVAMIFASVDLDWLNRLAAQTNLPDEAVLSIIDREGTVLARSPEPDLWVGRRVPEIPQVSQILAQGGGTAEAKGEDDVQRLYAFAPLDENRSGAYVRVGISTSAAFAAANKQVVRNLGLLAGVAALALAAAWFGGEWFVLRGVNALTAAAERLGGGALDARTGLHDDRGEIGQLARTFDAMAQMLEQREAERRAAENELQRRADDLARSNAELEQFAYVASHDLQEPLRMVSNYTQLLARRYGDRLDDEAREFIEFAVGGATRMQQLVQDLLLFSRVETRGAAMEPIESRDALDRALANLSYTISESDAVVTSDGLPAVVADGAQLAQLFQNLVGNAVKFHGEDRPEISVSAQRNGAGWQFAVRDNGIGIDPQFADRIFVIFQRLHSREQYAGTGIGLAICKKIVERHGGRIWVESEPGEGATFYFTLPDTEPVSEEKAA